MDDLDYALYQYINKLADEYVSTEELLSRKNLTFEEALREAEQFQNSFYMLLGKYGIFKQSLVTICYDLMERMQQQPENPELQYLYFCIMTDFGLLIRTDSEPTAEQKVRNYLKQQERMKELTNFLQAQTENFIKYQTLQRHLKKPIQPKNIEYTEEFDILYHLAIQHTFLYKSIGNAIFQENLNFLLAYANSDKMLRSVKPYILFAVLARKTGMMQNRVGFLPNLRAVFQYQIYHIDYDNGKNFNFYQSQLELYDHLQRTYADDVEVDISLCDFCFANLSPLSEWYYQNCEPNENIPMTLRRKVQTELPKSFPDLLSCEAYESLTEDELLLYGDAAGELREKMLQTAELLLKL